MKFEKQFTQEAPNEELSKKEKMTRRSFLKRVGAAAVVSALPGGLTACNSEKGKTEFNNDAYNNLEAEFQKRNLIDSKVYEEFRARFGNKAFNNFKKKYNLSEDEANARWASSIMKRSKQFLERAEKWQRIEKIATEMGIDSKSNLDVQIEDGEMLINGNKVSKKESEKIISTKSRSKEVIESADVDTGVY